MVVRLPAEGAAGGDSVPGLFTQSPFRRSAGRFSVRANTRGTASKFEQSESRIFTQISLEHFCANPCFSFPPYVTTTTTLCAAANQICDLPRQLFYCQELKLLNLNDNEITSIPPAINSLIHLQKLDLSRNSEYRVDRLNL